MTEIRTTCGDLATPDIPLCSP